MAHRDPSSPTSLPTILRYGIAVLSVAIANGLCFFLLQHFNANLTPFLFAVAATVWYAGTGPGVLAIILSVLSLNYLFIRPSFSFSPISYADLVYLTFCTLCALAVGWVAAVRRRSEQELRQARDRLQIEVQQRAQRETEIKNLNEELAKREREKLRQLESDLAHMNRVSMMGGLAASLSHEITQPIASAGNNARAAQNFLDMQPPDLGEVREALSCVVGDTDRAGDMIGRMRDQIKKAPPRKEQFDLNEAINEVIVLGRNAVIKNGVSVQTRLSEGLFPIHGDRVQLRQVVLNLLLNAVEAMGSVEAKPRDLLISTEQDHRGVLVAVRDAGPGLDPSHLERVFDAFYTTKAGGMGMGLSICRSIIDAHGGRLWAEANEPRGVIFQFTLPAVQVGR
ncbi:MAG: ATP-binding protein [Pseudolabrys sp.]|jgi:C4-dicarboxylate-specific signal transduction histidine kinase